MRKNLIQELSIEISLLATKLFSEMTNQKEFVLSKQFLKSSTSIGANIHEALDAQSRKDFIHKLSISLKEARETEYWLLIIMQSELVKCDTSILSQKVTSAIKVLTSIIKTSKKNSI